VSRALRAALGVLLAVAGCSRAPITSCDVDLAGTYVAEPGGARWAILDHGATLEAYPMFSDVPDVPGLEVAPRAIDLTRRDGGGITGTVRRRYLRGSASCIARARARVTRCADDAIDIVLADPPPPLDAACRAGTPAPSHRERWRRE
jgi:hypothetical protein